MKIPQVHHKPEISVVVPLFNEQENLAELHARLVQTLEPLGCSFEMVLVNDGSRDATGPMLDDLQRRDDRVVAVHLSRNFGQQPAYCAGIDQARGRAVVLMDGDLQDPPEVLRQFVEAWKQGGEVVYAVRRQRKESLWKRAGYALFYRVYRAVSDLDMPLDSGDFCLMDRKVVRALKRLPEHNRFLRGLRTFVGFRQVAVTYERAARTAGETKYTLKRLFRLAMDGLIGFSGLPLTMISWFGVITFFFALGMTGGLIAGLEACNPTLCAVLWLGAVQLTSLGVLGEYIRRIFVESKQRPGYIIGSIRRAKRAILPMPAKSA